MITNAHLGDTLTAWWALTSLVTLVIGRGVTTFTLNGARMRTWWKFGTTHLRWLNASLATLAHEWLSDDT